LLASSQTNLNERIQALLDHATAIRVSDLQRSIELACEALALSRTADDERLIAQSLSKLSLFYMITGQNEQSFEAAREAIKIFEHLGDERGIADAKYSIAGTCYKTDKLYLGLTYLNECLTIYKKHEDHFNLSRTYKSMATIYEYFGDENSAVKAYENSIASGKIIQDVNLVSNVYNPLSGIYLREGRTHEALALIEEAIEMKQGSGDVRGLAFSLYGRGKIFLGLGENEAAERDLLASIHIHEDMNEKLGKAMAVRKLGQLYVQMKQYERAREMANRTLELSVNGNLALPRVDALHLLYVISKSEGEMEQSLKHLEDYLIEKDRFVNDRSREMIQSFEVVSQLKALEMEAMAQRDRNQIIEKKNLELDAFFHRVSHDLKGPISSLVSIDALLRRELKDATILNFLDLSISQVHRINKILDELIMLTRVSHAELQQQPIDFKTIIDDILSSLEGLENFSHIRIETKIEKNVTYKAPWVLINTILQNLIENAIKYGRIDQRTPYVKINVHADGGLLQVVVTDNGIGLTKENTKLIFDMFYQVNKQMTGTGLGLYILQRAVEKLSGTVTVDSVPNRGSTFSIRLPLQ